MEFPDWVQVKKNTVVSKVSKIVLSFFMMSEARWTADENIVQGPTGGRVIPTYQNKSDVDTEIHAIGGAFDTENK